MSANGGEHMSKASASGALALAFASALASFCCLPVASGAFGIALASLAAALGSWWLALASGSALFLAIAVVHTLRGVGAVGADRCETSNRRRREWLFVGVIGVLTIALLSFPWWSAEIAYRLIR